jgi:hypothetical protein
MPLQLPTVLVLLVPSLHICREERPGTEAWENLLLNEAEFIPFSAFIRSGRDETYTMLWLQNINLTIRCYADILIGFNSASSLYVGNAQNVQEQI